MVSKRSQGGIIATVLIILLVLAAVIIVWNVVKKTTTEKAGEVDVSIISADLSIASNSVFNNAGQLSFSVTRGSDNANVSAIKIVIEDVDGKSIVVEKTDVPPFLETRTYTGIDTSGIGTVKKILVYPVSVTGKIGPAVIYEVPATGIPNPICTDTCASLNYNCETPTICGVPTNCGSCTYLGQTCVNYACVTPTGLVAYYPFTNNWRDESGNGIDGNNVGTSIVDGKLVLNGNSYVTATSNKFAEIYKTAPYTVSAWIKAKNSFPAYAGIVDVGNSGPSPAGGSGFGIHLAGSGGLVNFGYHGVNNFDSSFQNLLMLDNWYYVVGVYNSGVSPSVIYINGAAAGTSTSITSQPYNSSSLKIGFLDVYFNGEIDNVRIYNTALTQPEINQIYNSEKGGFPTCTPNCAGKVCGDDGCEGSCGSCQALICKTFNSCTNGQCIYGSLPLGNTDPGKCDNVGNGCSYGMCLCDGSGNCLPNFQETTVLLCDEWWGSPEHSGICGVPGDEATSYWWDIETETKVAPYSASADLSKGHVDCCNFNSQNGALMADTGQDSGNFEAIKCNPSDGRTYDQTSAYYGTTNIICIKTAENKYAKFISLDSCCGDIPIKIKRTY